MKNAYVLVDHHGDDGTLREGRVVLGLTQYRFDLLEKQGLIREATDAEVKAATTEAGDVAEPEVKKAEAPTNKQAPAPTNKAAPASRAKD
jgi:hypothetical protein